MPAGATRRSQRMPFTRIVSCTVAIYCARTPCTGRPAAIHA